MGSENEIRSEYTIGHLVASVENMKKDHERMYLMCRDILSEIKQLKETQIAMNDLPFRIENLEQTATDYKTVKAKAIGISIAASGIISTIWAFVSAKFHGG